MCEMKQKWEAYEAQIESAKELLSQIEDATYSIRINSDHDWSRDRFVEEYIAGGGELPYDVKAEEDYWEGVNYVAQTIAADVWFKIDDSDKESEDEDEWYEWLDEDLNDESQYYVTPDMDDWELYRIKL